MKNFIALLIFAGGFAGWYLYNEKNETADSLQQARQQLSDMDKSITERRAEFQRYSTVATLQKQVASKQAELKSLNDKLQSLGNQRSAVLQEQAQQRGIVRQAQVGKTITLTLISGRALGPVRILKIDDSGVSVANATGIVKVLPTELPAEIKQLFLY
jgi:hypothetical protein